MLQVSFDFIRIFRSKFQFNLFDHRNPRTHTDQNLHSLQSNTKRKEKKKPFLEVIGLN